MDKLFQDHLSECATLGTACAKARHNRDESTAQFIYRQYTCILALYHGAEHSAISLAYENAYKAESQSYNLRPQYFR